MAIIGLIASFHTIIYAQGRQIYSLSRAGYFPPVLSITHAIWKTPHVAMIVGAVVGLGLMMIIFWSQGADKGAAVIGGTLLNMAVAGAMLSYIAQAVSFILLRVNQPHIQRPYVSPLGIPGAVVTIVIATVTLLYQLADPVYRKGVLGVLIWFAVATVYFALVGRHKLILSPEEEFALANKAERARTGVLSAGPLAAAEFLSTNRSWRSCRESNARAAQEGSCRRTHRYGRRGIPRPAGAPDGQALPRAIFRRIGT